MLVLILPKLICGPVGPVGPSPSISLTTISLVLSGATVNVKLLPDNV